MEKAGVALIVEGLSKFQNDIQKANSSLKSLDTSGNFISRMLEGVTSGFSAFGQSMLRVAEVALGVLVRDAFLAVINGLKEIISATIEAGSEFQILELRLNRLNFNSAYASSQDFNSALRDGTAATKEQMTWIQRLAATTPYDFQDIANTFTLARSYGFVDQEARNLTKDITDFAAGMGLGNTEIERIIINMGQMVQQGKVTQREMNDLARGAFVPVNDIIKQMQINTGLTGKEFDKFKSSAAGVNAFMTAFSQIAESRFAGASEAMARTFKGATDNAKDFIKSIFGFGIVTPILDKVGGKIADVLASLTNPATFAAISLSVSRLGESLSGLIGDLIGGDKIDTGEIANRLIQGINRLTSWIDRNKPKILGFFEDMKTKVKEVWTALKGGDFEGFLQAIGLDQGVIDKVMGFRDAIVGAIDTIRAWADANGPTIQAFFETLGEIVGGVIENLTGMEVGGGGGLETFLTGVTDFMQYVIDNQEGITEFVTNLVKLWGVLQLIGFILTLILPPIVAFIGAILGIVAIVTGAIAVFQVLAAALGLILSPIGLIVVGIILLGSMIWWLASNWETVTQNMNTAWETVLSTFTRIKDGVVQGWQQWVTDAQTNLENLRRTFQDKFRSIEDIFNVDKWISIGEQIIDGIATGIENAAENVMDTLRDIAEEIKDLFSSIMEFGSPSKVFVGFGKNMMLGLAQGIEKASGLAVGAMESAAMAVSMPAVYASAQMGGMVSTQNNYTNNFALTVNSSAPTEPLIQDYNMLQSLAGG